MKRKIPDLSIGGLAALACHLECAAPKVGNVNRGADFHDVSLYDFIVSGQVIGHQLDVTPERAVGQTVLKCVEETRAAVGTNTNLGIVLLLVPLASFCQRRPADSGLNPTSLQEFVNGFTAQDAADIYDAIRLARPGGLQRSGQHDVQGAPPQDIVEAMRLAAERDLIARQWTNGFAEVLELAGRLRDRCGAGSHLITAIVDTHLEAIAEWGDSLISRKCGADVAALARQLAQQTLDARCRGTTAYHDALAEFDFWLRCDGNRRNPGATADLIAGALFVGLYQQWFPLTFR